MQIEIKASFIKDLKTVPKDLKKKVGPYRLGFIVEENTIVLVRFLHRKEIYRSFP